MTTFQTFQTKISQEKTKKLTIKIANSLGWKVQTQTENTMIFVTKFNFMTWGEIITIDFITDTDINVTVATKWKQLGDYGSGSKKIKSFVEQFLVLRNEEL